MKGSDQRMLAQATCFENDITEAISLQKFDDFEKAVSLYLHYLASFAPVEAFVGGWYSLIGGRLPFPETDVRELWQKILEELVAVDRISRLTDELRLSLGPASG
jgi:hypothetical protein